MNAGHGVAEGVERVEKIFQNRHVASVAHARASDAPLITKDETIRRHYRRTVW